MTPDQEIRLLSLVPHAEIRNFNLMRQLNELLKELGIEHAPRVGVYQHPVKKGK